MPGIGARLFALILVFVPSAGALGGGSPAYRGRFTILYMPIFCKKAPCPRGSYVVSSGGRRLADVKQVEVDRATPSAQRKFLGAFSWGIEPLAIDGDAWLPPGRSVVVIRADRALEGEWKP